ncbi:uncharacterized protein CXQ87_002881 [Candidozyma duobushaemuli]|uniref:Uncharacterized protein n=2 Tax=Candidozyma TaxID=3303203 RepID=A0ABX8I3V5_9ASCO|nr:uncharacterized protein CXQ87_002881 [[Candida] duobushaemulonis]PVH14734.1 hypothetical protein CXQ87_002881 [[Candida] duobushaemulonis]QWU87128.1 hypothetical protein CA3LBN_001393 [[Candida] haemuloni]
MLWKSLYAIAALVATAQADSITGCHAHGSDYFCINTDGDEGQVSPAPTGSGPSSYTSCHAHGADTYCMDGSSEVLFAVEGGSAASSASSASSVDAQTTAVTGCHNHGDDLFCIDGAGNEGVITPAPSGSAAPESFTGCHAHATETFCLDSSGNEFQFVAEEASSGDGGEDDEEMDCHYHAGVPHCVPKSGSSSHSHEATSCDVPDNEYNIPLRIGLIFAILAGDFIGVYAPLIVKRWFSDHMDGILVTLFRQFGTGVVLSTALVHLLTHAQMLFESDCLHTDYEATATSIAMAGIFIAFCIEFFLGRWLQSRINTLKAASGIAGSEEEGRSSDDEKDKINGKSSNDDHDHDHEEHGHHHLDAVAKQDKVAVGLLEAGIVFHSVLIGITLVVNPDDNGSFITLFIVILFHQIFEGVALGTRIAELNTISIWTKLAMGAGFAVTTPVGMAIGIGVLNQFNGNDPDTIVALGTLNSLSAGVLLWVGLIEMLNHDWLSGGLMKARWFKVAVGMFGLVAGMALMSFLGKWA